MTRVDQIRRLAVVMLTLLAIAGAPAGGQLCVGDCNSNGSVTVDELLFGLSIALGKGRIAQCTAFEERTDGLVTVDELVEGVQNALRGCPSNRVVKASSSVALSAIYVMDFGSLGASATGGRSLALTKGPILPAAIGGGAGLACDTLFCPFGGSETRCCDEFGALTFDWSQCILADGTEVDGSYRVDSFDEDPCFFLLPQQPSVALPPPFGIHFIATLENYSQASGDFFGNFLVFAADLVEEFEPVGAECSLISTFDPLFDPLGFAVRGDGTRYLEGSVRTIAGNGPAILQDVGTTFGAGFGEVAVDVIIDEYSEISCLVDTQIDGVLSSTNLLTGREFTETYDGFIVTQVEDFDGSFLIELNGTSSTDCLGLVDIVTHQPLRIFPGDSCPTGGELELLVAGQQSTSTVSYTDFGGVAFDFDSDGLTDETRFSCLDLSVDECSVQQSQQVCTTCSGQSDCGSGLTCASCVFCEQSVEVTRCAPQDDFAVCNDGVFGELFIDIVTRATKHPRLAVANRD